MRDALPSVLACAPRCVRSAGHLTRSCPATSQGAADRCGQRQRGRLVRHGRRGVGVLWSLAASAFAFSFWRRWEAFVPGPTGRQPSQAWSSSAAAGPTVEQRQQDASPGRRSAVLGGLLGAAPLLASSWRAEPGEATPLWRSLPQAEPVPRYPVRFVAYLTRFLLNYDADFKTLWDGDKNDIGPLGALESTEFRRDEKFARYARTVELSLAESPGGPEGREQLFKLLLDQFGTTLDAQRQLCILWALLQEEQPVDRLRALLRQVDNATIVRVEVRDGGVLFVPQPPPLVPENAKKETQESAATTLGDAVAAAVNATPVDHPVVDLLLPSPTSERGRRSRVRCELKPLDKARTLWTVASVLVIDSGNGYSLDQTLEPTLKTDAEVRQAPSFRLVAARQKLPTTTAPSGTLPRKLSALLPSSLLPSYNARLGRVIPDQSVPLTPNPTAVEEARRLDEVFQPEAFLDRFRADFVFAEFDPTYGPVGLSPLERERRLSTADYVSFGVSGAIAGLVRELVFMPVKTVKVRMQTDSRLGAMGVQGTFEELLRKEPVNLYRGVDASCSAAMALGLLSFGVTEYLKRELIIAFPGLNEVIALILASAVSVFVALVAYTPLEEVAARVMASPSEKNDAEPERVPRPYWGVEALQSMARASGLALIPELYESYGVLAVRELGFIITKFVVFDSLREGFVFLLPSVAESQSLLIACACGALAGAVATVVSHPLDTIFALQATGQFDGGKLPSLERLFRGLGPRILIFSPGIALSFVVYDFVKTVMGVAGANILQTLDVFNVAT